MTPDPECLSYEHEIVFALNKMTVGGFRHVPILNDDGVPVAVLSMRHLVEHIVSYYSDEVYNLPPAEDGFTSSREGA
jgi:CBS domain-containing protein